MAPRAPAAWVRGRGAGIAVLALALLAGASVRHASAAISLRMPVIPWYSVLRGGYIDLITRQPVTAQYSLASMGPVAPGAPGAFQPQNGLFNPAPKPTSRNIFPITLPSLAFWERCFKETDPLSALITKCNYQDTYTTCQQLANMGYLPKGVQSFEAKKMTGSFNLPMGCATASLGVSYDTLFRLTFNSPQVPVLAVITKDPIGSMVSYFGTGSTQGRVKHRLAHKAEFCYAPTISEISVSKSAIYSTGMTPGATSWSFAKSVELAPPYVGGRAVMFNGDTADATWTLQATKFGADVSYQGVVTGSITISNPTPAVITVNSIIDQITGGPASTVVCPVGTPFTVPACSFASCQYTSYYPVAPPPGTYTSAAQVSFQVLGSAGYPSSVQGTTAFNVGIVGSAGLATDLGTIAPGTAVVTDVQAPQSSYAFAGPGSQSFQTQVTCGGTNSSGAISNTAVLTAANGQQVTQSATIQKQCYDLQVSVATKAAPFVGRWGWTVTKSASPSTLALKPDPAAFAGTNTSAFGRDYGAMTSGDVVYTVTYTRNPPAGFVSGVPAFEASGEVYVQNAAPINARLQSVLIAITNSAGGAPYVTEATCPVLTVAAGARVACQWRATPTFNPVGQNVRGIARYINTRNGEPRGGTTDFTSAPITIGGGMEGDADAAGSGGRALLQTWGGARGGTTVGVLPELEAMPAMATTLYGADGSAMVVPNGVADGSAVIVSGAASAPGGAVLAVGDGVAVTLPKELRSGAVNEAGPANAAAALGLTGLQDECVDVADTFLTGDGNVQGRLISGTQPSGRVCSTTTFTYTMRYGPYADCAPRKSVNAATFQSVDTQARGSSQASVAVGVDGCMLPASLKIAPGRTLATTAPGYSWTVTKRADQQQLAIGSDATGIVTYTVEVKRSGGKGGATLAGDVAVHNPSAYPVPTTSATYTVTTLCDEEARTTSGPATCDAEAVPASGKVGCKFTAVLPCAGTGAYTIVLTAANGFVITGPPTPFAFNSTQLASASSGECADVKDVFLAGEGQVGGAVVSGTRPNGRLCGSKTFTYGVKFGPYTDCINLKAVNALSLTSNGLTKSAAASHTLPLYVVGCDVYTPAATVASDCVKPASWWSKCDAADSKCSQGWKLLPGGKGKGTLFFPKPNERSARTYETMLAGTPLAAAAAAKKAYVSAAQAFVGAQLNFLSGARLPSLELQETFDALGAFLSTNSEGSAMSDDQVAAINIQAGLLAKYNNGTLPALLKAPPLC